MESLHRIFEYDSNSNLLLSTFLGQLVDRLRLLSKISGEVSHLSFVDIVFLNVAAVLSNKTDVSSKTIMLPGLVLTWFCSPYFFLSETNLIASVSMLTITSNDLAVKQQQSPHISPIFWLNMYV